MDPLDMAHHLARQVEAIAEADTDPTTAYIARLGEKQYQTAQVAACMALVSIAEDLRELRHLLGPLAGDVLSINQSMHRITVILDAPSRVDIGHPGPEEEEP
jgi:hypothetical protein